MAYEERLQRKNDKKANIERQGTFQKWSFRERKTAMV